MRLNKNSIKDREAFQRIGIDMPKYDIDSVVKKAKQSPRWVHFGAGNIFRIFIGGIADQLLNEGSLDRGLTCVETFDYDVVDKIYDPYDNLAISVILNHDGTVTKRVLASMAEAVKADSSDLTSWDRMKAIFINKELQMVSFTITEKGYALKNAAGDYFPHIKTEIEEGPEKAKSAIGILTAMLYERFCNGAMPIALVSMDNCSQNGSLLRSAVITIAKEWKNREFMQEEFMEYVGNEKIVSFPWTMIDKITPRPGEEIAEMLTRDGLEDMNPVITSKRTYIAPFINAEKPQYLVIEDSFPNGRPELEKAFGVYMTDRATVNKAERMKVTACLNPVHSATGPIGVVLGIDLYTDLLKIPQAMKLAKMIAYQEGLPVAEDPKIISPKAFTDELFEKRFTNQYLGDTNLRLSTDVSQGVGVRFGETIKTYVTKEGSAEKLLAIPFGIAGWLRYMYGVDDQGNRYVLAPDPMNEEIQALMKDIRFGEPDSVKNQLQPVLSNENVFGVNLYEAGIGTKIENLFREMISGEGATLRTLIKYMD